MEGLLKAILADLEVENLSRQKAREALYYVNMLYKKEGDLHRAVTLMDLRVRIQKRMVELDTRRAGARSPGTTKLLS